MSGLPVKNRDRTFRNSGDSYSKWITVFLSPSQLSSLLSHMTTTARNSLLPLASREVGERPRGRTSDAGQVQKTLLDSAVRNSVRFVMG